MCRGSYQQPLRLPANPLSLQSHMPPISGCKNSGVSTCRRHQIPLIDRCDKRVNASAVALRCRLRGDPGGPAWASHPVLRQRRSATGPGAVAWLPFAR
ncbi:unnamed protein product [Boreogadus saida]